MNKNLLKFQKIVILALFITSGLTWPSEGVVEGSTGYQLAVLAEQAINPENVLLHRKIQPSNATVREFEWIIETLRSRCSNPEDELVGILVQTWRGVERRGYNVNLLSFSRELASFSNIAYQSYHNQKVDFQRVAGKWIKDKYPIKN